MNGLKELGNLKRIDPREIWESEPKDFTNWLRANIGKLAETIDLEIDITAQESHVGSFAADLIGRDLNSDRIVVIENQLEKTNHDHLGKLLTYAAGKEAKIVIWISPEFRDEHQQVLEWLNELSNEQTAFFGVEVEVLQIDEGKPAADFKIIAKPNRWQKAQAAPPVSEKQQKYQQFFADLLNQLKLKKPGITHANKASPANWFSFTAGKSGFFYSFSFAHGNRGFKSLPACQELISVNKAIPIRITAFQLLYWLHFNLAFEPSGWHINYPVSAKLLSSLSSKINAEAHRLKLDEICYSEGNYPALFIIFTNIKGKG